MIKAILVSGLLAAGFIFALIQREAKKVGSCDAEGIEEFERWKIREGKQYKSPSEQVYRLIVFCNARDIVIRHNSDPAQLYTKGINHFSDITNEEYAARHSRLQKDSPAKLEAKPHPELHNLGRITVPDSVDWSKTPVINRVYDKKDCSACYAFASIQAVEATLYLENRITEVLSVENIVDCTSEVPYTNSGCEGGCVFMSLRYIKEQGVATNESYPYTAGESGSPSYCQSKINRPYTISNYYPIPTGRSDLLKNLVASKPVAVSIYNFDIKDYHGGIYNGDDCKASLGSGFMLLVGYGVDRIETGSQKYWILKNHVGTNWGMKGFMKLSRDEGRVNGKCGITDSGVYVETN